MKGPSGAKGRLTLKAGGGTGRAIKQTFDAERLSDILGKEGNADLDIVVPAIIDLMFEQDREEATELNEMPEIRQKTSRQSISKIEKAASQLLRELNDLRETENGKHHFGKWFRSHQGFVTGTYHNYPDALFIAMLSGLTNVSLRHYRDVPRAEHWHDFIRKVAGVFEGNNLPVERSDRSTLSLTLFEIDRQFPGLAFPPGLVGTNPNAETDSRRKYIARALKGLKRE